MNVSDVMTREIAVVSPDSPLEDAVRIMVDRRLSGVPVVETNGRVVGMLTEGDLMRRSEIGTQGREPSWFASFFMPGNSAQDYVRTHGRKVGMLMSADVVSISPGASLTEAANLMQQHRIKRLPVIENGRLVGVLARADLLRVLADALKPHPAPSDPELRARIESELQKQAWIPKANIKADVDCGSVAFSGVVTDLRQRDALRVLAEAAGARSVRSNIICIDPVSGAALD